MEVEEAEAASRTFAFFFNWYAYVGTRLQKKAREEGRGGGGKWDAETKKKIVFQSSSGRVGLDECVFNNLAFGSRMDRSSGNIFFSLHTVELMPQARNIYENSNERC